MRSKRVARYDCLSEGVATRALFVIDKNGIVQYCFFCGLIRRLSFFFGQFRPCASRLESHTINLQYSSTRTRLREDNDDITHETGSRRAERRANQLALSTTIRLSLWNSSCEDLRVGPRCATLRRWGDLSTRLAPLSPLWRKMRACTQDNARYNISVTCGTVAARLCVLIRVSIVYECA